MFLITKCFFIGFILLLDNAVIAQSSAKPPDVKPGQINKSNQRVQSLINLESDSVKAHYIYLKETSYVAYPTGTTSSVSYFFRVGEYEKEESAGYFGDGLLPYLKNCPEALVELKKFHDHRTMSVFGYATVFGSVLFVTAIGPNKTSKDTYTDLDGNEKHKKVPKPEALVAAGVGVIGLIVGGYNYFAGTENIKNAVSLYNKKVRANYSEIKSLYVLPVVIGKNIGLGLNVSW